MKKLTLKEEALLKRPDLAKTHIEDLESIDKVLAGDKNAFESIFKKYYIHTYRAAMIATMSNEALSKDLAMEIMSKVYERLDKYKFETATFSSWLTFVRNNHIKTYFRLLRNNVDSVEDLGTNDSEGDRIPFEIQDSGYVLADDAMYNKDVYSRLSDSMSKLKENSRRALELIEIEEMSYDDAASEMGISLSNMKVTLLRAKKELKSLLMATGIMSRDLVSSQLSNNK